MARAMTRANLKIGVIRNPISTRNKKRRYGIANAALANPDILTEIINDTTSLTEMLAGFRAREVGLVVIDGGDGTAREVLSRLPEVYGDDLPFVSILPSGKTNLMARDLGTARHGVRAFGKLLEGLKSERIFETAKTRALMKITWPDGFHAPVRGMLMGLGAFRAGTDLAQSDVHKRGINHAPAVALAMTDYFIRASLGKDSGAMRAGEPVALAMDGKRCVEGRRFAVICTTLTQLLFGIWPFWGDDSRAIRYVDVLAPPKRLLRTLPAVARGKPRPWMEDAGYRSGSTDRMEMTLEKPFVVDGEMFQPGPEGRIILDGSERVRFLVP